MYSRPFGVVYTVVEAGLLWVWCSAIHCAWLISWFCGTRRSSWGWSRLRLLQSKYLREKREAPLLSDSSLASSSHASSYWIGKAKARKIFAKTISGSKIWGCICDWEDRTVISESIAAWRNSQLTVAQSPALREMRTEVQLEWIHPSAGACPIYILLPAYQIVIFRLCTANTNLEMCQGNVRPMFQSHATLFIPSRWESIWHHDMDPHGV